MNILISWYAYQNDFDRGEGVKVKGSGPTMQFHDNFYESGNYAKHILLSTSRETDGDLAIELLTRAIHKKYPQRVIEPVYMNVSDPIDLPAIKNKIERVLLTYRGYGIDIFFSPGTSAMQVSWYICHSSLGLRTRLLQTRSPQYSSSKQPELLEIQVETSPVPYSAIIAEHQQKPQTMPGEYLITDQMKPLYDRARLVAQADGVTCLINGASGTGKEHLARYIHQQSSAHERSFIAVNCSALGDQLLESRLFGYVKGAFTDAKEDKTGYFDAANGGTLFLDEIGDISPYMQQLLLRVLQESEFMPVGATKARKVFVRVIAATHRDLDAMCEAGTFRRDLYYRLAVVELGVKTLQQRGESEKKQLIDYFLEKARITFRKPKLHLSRQAMDVLVRYPFPGNVRELENLMTTVAVFSDEAVELADLPARVTKPITYDGESLNWKTVEKNLIVRALEQHKGNQRRAWQAVGYKSLNTFRNKLKEYGIVA
jgi:transcriptional regulator with PAS, ATPase and Fis domain